MKRRAFVAGLAGTAAWPLAARAQQAERVRRIGVLMDTAEDNAAGQARVAALRRGLQPLGWTEGHNLQVDFRWGRGDVDRTRTFAAELVSLSPDVIFAYAKAQLAPLSRETRTIPIVFVGASDPVGDGYVANFARPGGNITGFTLFEPSIAGKWLGALKEIVPAIARVAMMVNPDTAPVQGSFYRHALETAAATLMVEPSTANVRSVSDIETAIAALSQRANSGLIVASDTFTNTHSELIVKLAGRHRLPAIYPFRFFATAGGLISYGPDEVDACQRSAAYIDRILRGESPAELPIQPPVKFELVINLKAAKAIGITIPESFLMRADEVIE